MTVQPDPALFASFGDAVVQADLRRRRWRAAGIVFSLSLLFAGLVAAVFVGETGSLAVLGVLTAAFGAAMGGFVYAQLGRPLRQQHAAAERAREATAKSAALAASVEELQHLREAAEARARELNETHRQWMHALESVPEPIFLHDREFRVLQANRAYAERAGLPLDAIIGRPYWQVFPLLPAPLANCARLVRESGAGGTAEDEFQLADGQSFVSYSCRVGDGTGPDSYSIHILENVTERNSRDALMRRFAHHDQLTGLPNRVLFEDRFQQEVLRAQRHGGIVVLMVMDLDRFKPVNDTYGHQAGDQLLQTVAQRLLGCVRKTDTVVRFGGDEFVLLLAEVNDRRFRELVASKAAHVIDAISQPVEIAGNVVTVGASIGISCYPEDGDSLRTLLHAADEAMYLVKQQGRNGYRFAGEAE